MATTIKIDDREFSVGVSICRKLGGRFNAATKTWTMPENFEQKVQQSMANVKGGWDGVDYASALSFFSLRPASGADAIRSRRPDPATTWMGDASMEAENSIF